MTGAPVVKRIPGNLPKFRHEKDGFVCLTELSKTELLDLLHREKKLLSHKKFLEKLPDKGKKILDFYRQVDEELKRREEHENLCGLIASLNVSDPKQAVSQLEWTRKNETGNNADREDENNPNPLEIIATHSGTSTSKQKNVNVIELEQPLDPSAEKEEVDSFVVDVYAQHLCERFDSNRSPEARKRFYTHKSLNKISVKEVIEKEEPVISSCNDPKNLQNTTKVLTLQESIVIQQQQTRTLKEIEIRHAAEKLQEKIGIKIGNALSNTAEYRKHVADSDDETCSVTTNQESDDDDRDTATFYNLVDDAYEDQHS